MVEAESSSLVTQTPKKALETLRFQMLFLVLLMLHGGVLTSLFGVVKAVLAPGEVFAVFSTLRGKCRGKGVMPGRCRCC